MFVKYSHLFIFWLKSQQNPTIVFLESLSMLYLEPVTLQTHLRCVTNRHEPSKHVKGRHGACCPLCRQHPAKFSVLFNLHPRRDDVSEKERYLVLTIWRKISKLGRNKILIHNLWEDFFTMALQTPLGQGLLVIEDSLSRSVRHTTLGRDPLGELSARSRDLYLTKHNTHKRMTSIPQRDSNQKSQQASGCRTTPYTARPMGSALEDYTRISIATCCLSRHSGWLYYWLHSRGIKIRFPAGVGNYPFCNTLCYTHTLIASFPVSTSFISNS
jgi:hypothetical protein